MRFAMLFCAAFLISGVSVAEARDIGEVSTTFRMLGVANDKIKLEVFEDPKIDGVSCTVARAVTGGVKGAIGIAEDTSDASIACTQTGPIRFREAIAMREKGEEVFNERRSILFKKLRVTRFFDKDSNMLIYLTWSEKLIEGSPKNAVSAVALRPWGSEAAGTPLLK
ncbi:MAG: creA protein [Micavibrio sp.]|nr:creA protein [Micavibrio sp.]